MRPTHNHNQSSFQSRQFHGRIIKHLKQNLAALIDLSETEFSIVRDLRGECFPVFNDSFFNDFEQFIWTSAHISHKDEDLSQLI
jgi:hypothetical protein